MTEHRVSAGDAGSTVRVSAGDLVALELPENAATGYVWSVDVDGPGTVVADERVLAPAPAPGAGGTRRVVIRLEEAGRSEVVARKRRPWEGSGAEVETVALTVEAVEPG